MAEKKPLSWLMIILILLGVALVSGFLFGGVGGELGVPYHIRTWGMPIVIGITIAFLLHRRSAQLAKLQAAKKHDSKTPEE